MNYPDSQRIGRLGELDAERLFTDWSWTVGHDHLDTGYDLNVEPDIQAFHGHRFLVQVKGTADKGRRNTWAAPVSKKRLREYANNPLPVFLVRATTEGEMRWLHVQAWAKANTARLAGNGDARIVMPAEQTLASKELFSAYLKEVFRPAAQRATALTDLAQERSDFLSSIDPKFGVNVGVRNGTQTYEIYAKSKDAQLSVEMTVNDDPANKATLRDAIIYGLPASVEMDAFRVTGSPLLTELGAGTLSKVKMELRSNATRPVKVTLYPGRAYSMIANSYSFAATLYMGRPGFSIRAEDETEIFSFDLRARSASQAPEQADITMGLRPGVLGSMPIQRLDGLAALGKWAEQAVNQDGIYADLSFPEGRMPLVAELHDNSNILPVLRFAQVLGVIQQVAKALNSDIVVDDDLVLDEKELSNLYLAYALLRGERRTVGLPNLDFNATGPVEAIPHGDFFITTAITLTLGGKPFGVIPVAIDLERYSHSMTADNQHRITRDDDGNAVMYYDEHATVGTN